MSARSSSTGCSGPGATAPRGPRHHPRRDADVPRRRSSTRRGATSTARSSTTARSPASTTAATAGRPPTRSCAGCARTRAGLDVGRRGHQRQLAALALQGPLSRAVLEAVTGQPFADLRYFRRRAATVGWHRRRRQPHRLHRRPGLRAVGRRRPAAGALGRAHRGRRRLRAAAGGHAGAGRGARRSRPDHARGRLHLLAPRPHPRAELLAVRDRPGPAGRPGQGRARSWAGSPSGARSTGRPGATPGRPGARLVDLERLVRAQGWPPACPAAAWRSQVPVFAGRRAGRSSHERHVERRSSRRTSRWHRWPRRSSRWAPTSTSNGPSRASRARRRGRGAAPLLRPAPQARLTLPPRSRQRRPLG